MAEGVWCWQLFDCGFANGFCKLLPESLACRLYLAVVLVETTIDLAIEGDLFLRVRKVSDADSNPTARRMPVYLAIFALAQYVSFQQLMHCHLRFHN